MTRGTGFSRSWIPRRHAHAPNPVNLGRTLARFTTWRAPTHISVQPQRVLGASRTMTSVTTINVIHSSRHAAF